MQHRRVDDSVEALLLEHGLRDVTDDEGQVVQRVSLPGNLHRGFVDIHAHHVQVRVQRRQGLAAEAKANRTRIEANARADSIKAVMTAEADGERARNEIFVGHRTHQSARYRLSFRSTEERQSSSGVIVSTGTGATGWARSIHRNRQTNIKLPRPGESRLVFFVREAFPSRATGTDLTDGSIREKETLEVVSEMNEDGVIFGDGIEDDRIEFRWGMRAEVRLAKSRLHLVRE
jgi:hypothetical protein